MKRKRKTKTDGYFNACRIGAHFACSESSNEKKCACPCHSEDKREADGGQRQVEFHETLFKVVMNGAMRISGGALFDDDSASAARQKAEAMTCANCKKSMKYIGYSKKGPKGKNESRVDFAVCPSCDDFVDFSKTRK